MEKLLNNKICKLLLIVGAVYFFLKLISPVFSPAIIALVFLAMFGPFLKNVSKRLHINRQIGAIFLIFIFLSIIVLITFLLFSWMVGELPELIKEISSFCNELCEKSNPLYKFLNRMLGIDSENYLRLLGKELSDGERAMSSIKFTDILSKTVGLVQPLVSFLGFLLVFIVAAILLAGDYDKLMNKLLDREEFHFLLELLCGVLRYIGTYLRAQLIIMTIIGTLCAITLYIAKIRFGILFGILAGILDALPLIGTGTVLVPLSVFQIINGEYVKAIVCIVLYVICIVVREFTEPKLIGGRTGISPAAIITSMYAGVKLFGLLGIIKGPLGLIIIWEIVRGLDGDKEVKKTEEI